METAPMGRGGHRRWTCRRHFLHTILGWDTNTMSMIRCDKCERFIDTDVDDGAFVEGDPNANGHDVLCAWCREELGIPADEAPESNAKHTPGPWFMGNVYPQRESAPGCDVGAESGENICLVHFDEYDTSKRVCTANSRLIAAAPELKQLAIQYRDDLRHPITDSGSLARRLEAIETLLAKIEGEGQ